MTVFQVSKILASSGLFLVIGKRQSNLHSIYHITLPDRYRRSRNQDIHNQTSTWGGLSRIYQNFAYIVISVSSRCQFCFSRCMRLLLSTSIRAGFDSAWDPLFATLTDDTGLCLCFAKVRRTADCKGILVLMSCSSHVIKFDSSYSNKWRQTFPNQPEIPEDQVSGRSQVALRCLNLHLGQDNHRPSAQRYRSLQVSSCYNQPSNF